MAQFKITITDEVLVCHDRNAWQRMVDFIDADAPDMVGHQDLPGNQWVYSGDATPEVVTVLQAAARGEDLWAVLDMIGAPP